MRPVDLISPKWEISRDYPLVSPLSEEPFDLESIKILSDFSYIPHDYLILFSLCGKVGFTSIEYDFIIDLNDPVEAHELYFEEEREGLMPNLYPAVSAGSSTLYCGTVEGRQGVYIVWDSSSWLSMAKYVAPSLTSLLFEGVGLEVINQF